MVSCIDLAPGLLAGSALGSIALAGRDKSARPARKVNAGPKSTALKL